VRGLLYTTGHHGADPKGCNWLTHCQDGAALAWQGGSAKFGAIMIRACCSLYWRWLATESHVSFGLVLVMTAIILCRSAEIRLEARFSG